MLFGILFIYSDFHEPFTFIYMAEAVLIYLLDFSDSRMAALEKEIPNVNKGEFSNPIGAFDRKCFYVPNIK